MKFNHSKFRTEIISFLKQEKRKYGDISDIANHYIKGSIDLKNEVDHELCYLTKREILVIEEWGGDEGKTNDDWWGNFKGHNPAAGYKTEGLHAMLGNKYLDLSWKDRHYIWWQIIVWAIPILATIAIPLIIQELKKKRIDPKSKTGSELPIIQKKLNDTLRVKNINLQNQPIRP